MVGVLREDLANWYPAVQKEFDGLSPFLVDVNIPLKGCTVTALFFETDRAPFVVRNSLNGADIREVPWHEGTRIRSAYRSDLLKLLVPIQQIPDIDVLSGSLSVEKRDDFELLWTLSLMLYVKPRIQRRIVVPFHECAASFEFPSIIPVKTFREIRLMPPHQVGILWQGKEENSRKYAVMSTADEVFINGPGKVSLTAFCRTDTLNNINGDIVNVNVKLQLVHANTPVSIDVVFTKEFFWILR